MSTKFWQRVFSVLVLAGMLVSFVRPGSAQANPRTNSLADVSAPAVQAASGLDKVETQVLDTIATSGSSDFMVRFTEQADLSAAYTMAWKERGEFVYNTLKAVAARSQAKAIAYLIVRGIGYQTLFAGNDLYVKGGDRTAVESLSALTEVASIRALRTYQIDPVEIKNPALDFAWVGELVASKTKPSVDAPASLAPDATVDWGITDTHAQEFWSTFGFKGEGIVVANIDTGVQWDHPALVDSFKCGTNPSDPACWADPSNICGGSACDNNGHGTHTMGTMVANDDQALPYIAGMAPNAEWIACKGCESSSCSSVALTTCADWLLAPGGDTANRPNVVNNSWGGGGGDPWYLSYVQAWRAAGIFPAFSAGNNYSCSSMGDPGTYQESFASASHMSNRTISDFSSKGPSPFGDDPYTKPNISAPGSSICSTVPGGWSCGYSGTSMASPHSAGAVALLWSCNPGLVGQVDQTFQILQNNADVPPAGSCGAPADGEGNYTYGYGYLNPYAAGLVTCGATGTLAGHVDDGVNPIQGATIQATLTPTQTFYATTNASGDYSMSVLAGTYTVDASAYGFLPDQATGVVVTEGATTIQDFTLTQAPNSLLRVWVEDVNTGWPLYAVTTISGTPWDPIWNNPVSGYFEVSVPNGSSYTLGVDAWTPGYLHQDVTVGPISGDTDVLVELEPDLATCNAPGYALGGGLAQNFDTASPPGLPSGWGEVVVVGTGLNWDTNAGTSWPGGYAAHSDPNLVYFNSFSVSSGQARLYTLSPFNMTAFSDTTLVFWMFRDTGYSGSNDRVQVQVSTDGGATWVNVGPEFSRYSPTGFYWEQESVDLSAYSTETDLMLGFLGISEYGNDIHLDDIALGGTSVCTSPSGGLVVGNVYDAKENLPLEGATVSNDAGYSTVTAATLDPLVDDAFYVLYSPAGSHQFTASFTGFGPDVKAVNVVAGDTVAQDFHLPAGHLTFDPLSMHVTLDMGTSTTQPLTITNDGTSAATFAIAEVDKGFVPVANTAGHGEWLYKSTQGVEMKANNGTTKLAYPSAYRWTPDVPSAAANILIYADDYIHTSPNTLLDQALQALALPYTAYYDGNFSGFTGALAGGGWDLVLVDDENYGDSSIFAPLNDYVLAGGKLVINTWYLFVDPTNPLWATMGVTYIADNYEPPWPTYWWLPDHPVFESVPQFTDLDGGFYGIYGNAVEPLPNFVALAGYTTPGPDPNQAALVLGNEDRTIFKGFADAQNSADLDSDGLMDGAELYMNMINGLLGGFGGDVPWLSESPITGTVPAFGGLYGQRLVAETSGGTQQNPGLTVSAPATSVSAKIETPANPSAVLWDQPLSSVNQNAYVDQEFSDFTTYSSFLADDFINTAPWGISTIYVPGDGWNGFSTLLNAPALHWAIYADCAGIPCGDPSGGGAAPVWSLSLPPTDAQVSITTGTPGGYPSNTTLNLVAPVLLAPGHYWLVFYPTLDFTTNGQFGRQPSDTTNGYTGQFINPGGGFAYGTAWQNWTVLGATQTDIAFRLDGSVLPYPSQVVQVTFDAGVAEVTQPGDYLAQLKISSDTPYAATTIPVTMTVIPPATYGKLEGTVIGLGYCDSDPAPLEGAVVYIEGSNTGMTWTLETDASGYYSVWMDAANTPVTIHVSAAEHVAQDRTGVVIVGQTTTTENFDLRWLEPCVTESPAGLSVDVLMGATTSTLMTLENAGAEASTFDIKEVDGGYSPNSKGHNPTSDGKVNPNIRISSGAQSQAAGSATNLSQYGKANASGMRGPMAPAAEVLLNQPPNGVNGLFSDADCSLCGTGQQSIAENFFLPEGATIGQIVFWTGYYPGDIPQDPDQITVIIHTDAGGAPGTEIYTEANVAYERQVTGVVLFGVQEWVHTLTLASPVSLDPGTYWVEIYNNTVGNSDQFFWETGDLDPVYGLTGSAWATSTPGSGWTIDGATDLAIQLVTAEMDVPWLAENPTSGVLVADTGLQDVTVSFDSSVVPQPGKYYATLKVKTQDPVNGMISVPVTMTVRPTADYGILQGTVTGLGYCDDNPAPLEGATILIESPSSGMTYTVETAADGTYSRWLSVSDGPYIVSVTADGYEYKLVSDVVVPSQGTVVVDFDLRWLEPCVSAAPSPLVVDVPLGTDMTVVLDILNKGAVSSLFKIAEKPAPVKRVEATLWDQPLSASNQNAYVDQEFSDFATYSSYLADDFTNADPWVISTIFVPGNGWNGFSSLNLADSLTWAIFADCAGVPCGDPSGAGDLPLWSITLSPSDPQVVISTGSGGMPSDALLTLDEPANLEAGTYWLIYYPTGAFAGFGQFGRQPADTTNGYTGQFVNPGGGFGYGTVWQDWNVLGMTETDIAFRLEGEIGNQDIPWLAESPITGTIGHGPIGSPVIFPVDVTFTAFYTMSIGGVYTGSLIIKTDDPINPKIVVPVTMNVVEPVYGVAVSADQVGSGEPGTVVSYTVTVTNTSNFSSDSFTVTLGTHAFDTGLGAGEDPVIVVGPLAMGESATFVVTVHIPADAVDGAFDTVQITVTSIGDPEKFDSVTLTTNVFVSIINVYLPIMWKSYP